MVSPSRPLDVCVLASGEMCVENEHDYEQAEKKGRNNMKFGC